MASTGVLSSEACDNDVQSRGKSAGLIMPVSVPVLVMVKAEVFLNDTCMLPSETNISRVVRLFCQTELNFKSCQTCCMSSCCCYPSYLSGTLHDI